MGSSHCVNVVAHWLHTNTSVQLRKSWMLLLYTFKKDSTFECHYLMPRKMATQSLRVLASNPVCRLLVRMVAGDFYFILFLEKVLFVTLVDLRIIGNSIVLP